MPVAPWSFSRSSRQRCIRCEFGVFEQLPVQLVAVGGGVGFAVAIGTKGDAVAHPVGLFHTKDVVDIQESWVWPVSAATRAFAPVAAPLEHRLSDGWVTWNA